VWCGTVVNHTVVGRCRTHQLRVQREERTVSVQRRQAVPGVLAVLEHSKDMLTRPVILGPVVALAVRHIPVVTETHQVLDVSTFFTVDDKAPGIQFFDFLAAVRRGGRPAAADVQNEIAWAVSQEFRQVRVVLAVLVGILYVQLHVPVQTVHMFSSTTGGRDNQRNLRRRFAMRKLHSIYLMIQSYVAETRIVTSDV